MQSAFYLYGNEPGGEAAKPMKQTTRAALGPLYPILIRAKSAPVVVKFRSLTGALPWHLARQRGGGMAVILSSPVGMGAVLCHALLLHAYFADEGMNAEIKASSPLYSEADEDFLARFFKRPSAVPSLQPLGRSATEYLIRQVRPDHMPLSRAYDLFATYFSPSDELNAAISAATDILEFDLSIHFRGTDKFLESGHVGYEGMFAAIRAVLSGSETGNVFLATDDAGFSAELKAQFPGLNYTSYDLGEVQAGLPRHFSDLSPTAKALEALVNIFLLARSKVCIRTSSYMSAASTFVNPALRTVTINQTTTASPPFPEAELLAREAEG